MALHWAQHKLSYFGRAHVAKQVLAAMLVYHAGFVLPPPHLWACIRSVLSSFLAGAAIADGGWGGGIRHPGQAKAALPWEHGGIALVDIDLQRECLLAKVVARLLQPGPHPWKQLLDSNVQAARPALGPALAVSGARARAGAGLSHRHAEYFRAFQLTMPHRTTNPADLSTNQVLTERLFHNRQIQRQGQPLKPRHHGLVTAAGVFSVRDLAAARAQDGGLPAHLQSVWDCLPPAWQHTASLPPLSEWWLATQFQLVRRDVGGGQELFDVRPDGSLLPLDGPPPPAAAVGDVVWLQCCVVTRPLPGNQAGG
jgi:hypothetical protein